MRAFLFGALLSLGAPAAAQTPSMQPIAAQVDADAISLGTGGVPDGHSEETWFLFAGQRTVRNVTRATLTPVLPSPGKATGAAVIVAPGGGFLMLSMDNEGWPVARWLADHGIAAFVLKYRLKPTPTDQAEFGRALRAIFARPPLAPNDRTAAAPDFAVEDGIAALQLVRSRAAAWGVDPARVGMLGFSAGAMTTLGVVAKAPAGAMPAFVAPIYGSMNATAVPAAAPPLFAALAADDPLFGKMGYGLVQGWQSAGHPAELHVYQAGGHGFGMGRAGTTSSGWIEAFRMWLDANGILNTQR